MAGMLPGVGVDSRRTRHHRRDSPLLFREPPLCLRERIHNSSTTATIAMPETALVARQRLDRKLAHFRASPRSGRGGGNENRESSGSERSRTRSKSIGSKILGRGWKLQVRMSGRKSEGEMCSVCLENFDVEGEQQVMELSCSHRYHSKCLTPWLAAHPHCPTCRNPVQRPLDDIFADS